MGYFSRLVAAVACISLLGCVTQSAVQFSDSYDSSRHGRVHIEPCVDRTGFGGQRNLSAEATESLTKKLMQMNIFTISSDGDLILVCEIEKFVDRRTFLFVFFEKDRYDGYMWFSSLPQPEE